MVPKNVRKKAYNKKEREAFQEGLLVHEAFQAGFLVGAGICVLIWFLIWYGSLLAY